jgi:hypothetical protein
MERASPISPVVLAASGPALVARSAAAQPAVPVVLRATRAEAVGANMRVGGVRIVDRAIRHLARLRDAHVVVASDGSIRLPRRLPPGMELQHIDGDPQAGVAALAKSLGDAMVVGADTVWLQTNRPDRGTRVVDGATRRTVEDAVFADLMRGDDLGLVARLLNKRISLRVTRYLLAHLPIVTPNLATLAAGLLGLYGVLLIATGTRENVVLGFLLAQAQTILDGCGVELARLRFRQTTLTEWVDTVVDDLLNLTLVLAVGLAVWRRGAPVGVKTITALSGGTFWDMKLALAAAGMLLFYDLVAYRELIRQGEGGDVLKVRWWFSHGQSLRNMSGAGSRALKAVLGLGRRDFVVFAGLLLVYVDLDLLPIVLLYMLVLAVVHAGAALGQLLSPDWRIRPPA